MKLTTLIAIAAVATIAVIGFDKYKSYTAARAEASLAASITRPQAPIGEQPWGRSPGATADTGNPGTSQFKCDGRTHCSHMTSCAEAVYFLQHCPNTQMDGDNDGDPCEKQWCN